MAKEIFLSKNRLIDYLSTTSKEKIQNLFFEANELCNKIYGNKVFFRGIIEFSNICNKNCLYCGLRKDLEIERYQMTKEDILKCAEFCYKKGYGSLVLQSGEFETEKRIEFLSDVVSSIKKKFNLGMTLSLGELSKDSLKELFKSGAHRYLIRIETSNEELYNKIHPKDHSFKNRINTLENLKSIGYQVGTGVMIGLPFQTIENLADDIIFFKNLDVDMLGMGPYVQNPQTPLFIEKPILANPFELALKMVALCRVYLKDVNIAATTALQTFDKKGREKALLCGANILMPIVTPTNLRKNYLIYPDKPCIEDTKEKCFNCISARLKSINKEIGYNKLGDSFHFFERKKKYD